MKGLFKFGRARRRRLAMTFGYECRPSFWRTIRSNSHLVIAAAGTASFLGVAGVALWLAMPSAERAAFAEAKPDAVVEQPTVIASTVAAATTPVLQQAEKTVPKAASAAPKDVRWKDPNAAAAPEAAAPSSAQASLQAVNKEADATKFNATADTASEQLSAFAEANRAEVGGTESPAGAKPDHSSTAAIPTPKPRQATLQASAESEPAADGDAKDKAGAQGHTLRAVTMRAGPKKGAAVMATVPAKTAVQIVACNQWCEIVYNGKRGWIYKSYVARGN